MKTNYFGHENAYKKFKQEGKHPGWCTTEQLKQDIKILDRILQYDSFPNSGKILELGCGAGNISIYLAQKGYEVSGVDISPTAVEWAIENAKKADVQVDFKVGDVLKLEDIANESFDIVLDGHCFHCIIGDDRSKFLQSAWRILKSDGILCIRTMCNEVPEGRFRKNYDPETQCEICGDTATRYIGLSNDILIEVIHEGLQILQMEMLPPFTEDDLEELLLVTKKNNGDDRFCQQ